MSFDWRIGNCKTGGYFGHFSRAYVDELEMQHGVVDNRGNGVHLLLQFLHHLQLTLHLSTMEGVSLEYGARLAAFKLSRSLSRFNRSSWNTFS